MQPGDLIAGKYRIDQVLGQGGMGVVVAATNLHIDQRVALKFLLPELLSDGAVVERFLREARASARLRSEHICRVHDVGLENGAPFMVMELLDGRDLASMLSAGGPMPVAVAADCVLQATMGLAEAHALGIVHRDLKPANLFVTRRLDGTPLVKILDFGIAKAPSDTQFNLTRTTAVMGSPGYMSPEQLRSTRDADARSDIWALGVTLFELVAGRPPFTAESITELTLRVAMDPTPPLPGVPREFAQVVARCLEKDPSRRFANVSQLAAALAPFGSARVAEAAVNTASMLSSPGTRPGAASAFATPGPAREPTTLGSAAGTISARAGRRAGLRWGLAGAAVASIIGTVMLVNDRDQGAPEATMTQPGDERPVLAPREPRAANPPSASLVETNQPTAAKTAAATDQPAATKTAATTNQPATAKAAAPTAADSAAAAVAPTAATARPASTADVGVPAGPVDAATGTVPASVRAPAAGAAEKSQAPPRAATTARPTRPPDAAAPSKLPSGASSPAVSAAAAPPGPRAKPALASPAQPKIKSPKDIGESRE